MKKIIVAFVYFLFSMPLLQAQDQVVVDANATLRTLTEPFHRIRLSGNIKLVLSQSEEVSLAVSASQEKYITNIKTVVDNGTLRIYWDGENWNGNKSRSLTVYLSFKEISEIEASGASSVTAAGTINLQKLSVDLSGASSMKVNLNAQLLTLELSGASSSTLQGVARILNVECSGASDVNLYGLIAETCNATASGASDMELNATRELNAIASGASHIYYKGEAITSIKSSGVSKIYKRD